MKLITDQPEIVARFVATGIKRTFWPPYTALGWVQEHGEKWKLVGGAVFNDYNGHNIEVSIHWTGLVTRQPIREMLKYVFVDAKCGRLTAKTERGNVLARRLIPRMGFQFEGELKRFYGPRRAQNALVFRMDNSTAERWINGQRSEPSSGS